MYHETFTKPTGPPLAPSWLLAIAVRLAALPPLLLVCQSITAEALRELFDVFGTKLHKLGLPFIERLAGFRETRNLDLAHVMALTIMACVWMAWEWIVTFVCYPPAEEFSNRWRLVWGVGSALLMLDAALFFVGITTQSGSMLGSGTSPLTGLLLTALYVCVVVFVAYLVVETSHK
jgi:hypothetical protein